MMLDNITLHYIHPCIHTYMAVILCYFSLVNLCCSPSCTCIRIRCDSIKTFQSCHRVCIYYIDEQMNIDRAILCWLPLTWLLHRSSMQSRIRGWGCKYLALVPSFQWFRPWTTYPMYYSTARYYIIIYLSWKLFCLRLGLWNTCGQADAKCV